jgi:hypothetical protein
MDFFKQSAIDMPPAASENLSVSAARNRITGCCQALGRAVDERLSADKILLHFHDPLIRIRKVLIGVENQGAIVSFTVSSAVKLPAKQAPAAVLGHLLLRNGEQSAVWRISIGDDDQVSFVLGYRVPAAALAPSLFKMLCENMVKEVHVFDAKMHEAGLI